jgi:hypothetical protein
MLQNANIQYYITLLINNFSINACNSLSDNTDAKDNKVVSGNLSIIFDLPILCKTDKYIDQSNNCTWRISGFQK